MYVLKVNTADGPDFSTFRSLFDARQSFERACSRVADELALSAYLFESPAARAAAAAIRHVEMGRAILIERDPWAWIGASIRRLLRRSLDETQ